MVRGSPVGNNNGGMQIAGGKSSVKYTPPKDKPFTTTYRTNVKRDECGRQLSNIRVLNHQGHC